MIQISQQILDEIRTQALKEIPNEACGYLAGTIQGQLRRAVKRLPLTNVDASPEHFSFSPQEQFSAVKQAREEGLELISVYHSHPVTPARMSQEDIRLANDTSTIYLIYAVEHNDLKGFTIDREKKVSTHPVEVLNASE
ncbi:MAG: M67 family metallopeptidase [Spirochaetales bacterium]|nr:M67 family metallopeptidase [Spirochaetales bacterium]